MQIIEIDTEQFNEKFGHLQCAYREHLTTYNDAEGKMREWFRYMNYPRDTKVYKYSRSNGIKWIVKE